MGLAEGALRQWIDAEDHLVAALASHDTPWIENPRNREALEHALAAIRGHIGRVAVVGPTGAEVTINGKPVGRLPLPEAVRITEGSAEIAATATGRRSAQARTDVAGGSTVTVTLDLPVLSPPLPLATPFAAPGSLIAPVEAPRSRAMTWTGASLLVVSAAALATGIVWVAVDGNPTCSAPSGTVCQYIYDTKTQGWLAIVSGAAAGAAGAGLIWYGRPGKARVALGPASLKLAAEF